jgi:LmbE family N-acetylglucosaminyl deacetylase
LRVRVLPVLLASVAIVSLKALDLPLTADRGAAGAWQKIQKAGTFASAMHITAHPDDEDGGMLTWLSRGLGARTSLLTLTRGEAGDNAIGSELFDALGLVRTEELAIADRHYGVDDQYFTSVIDYGFSKRLDEAWEKWGHDNVLRDVVHIIRLNRPLVIIARFQGNERDGHPNHQVAGIVAQEAFRVAGDPSRYTEQLTDRVRPWQPLKLYMGGLREDEDWTIRVDAGEYSPWLGDSFKNFALLGLSFQRSQNAGIVRMRPGASYTYYKRLASIVEAPPKEASFFDGIDTTISGLFKSIRADEPAGAHEALLAIQQQGDAARNAFTAAQPWSVVPALADGLRRIRDLRAHLYVADSSVVLLNIKERQFVSAINASLGLELSAFAQASDTKEPSGRFAEFAAPATMAPVVPGQTFNVRLSLTNRSGIDLHQTAVVLERDRPGESESAPPRPLLAPNENISTVVRTSVPADATLSAPYFTRKSLSENRYSFDQGRDSFFVPFLPAPWRARATYTVERVEVDAEVPVERREPALPYGYTTRELAVVPALSVALAPRRLIVPLDRATRPFRLTVDVVNNDSAGKQGELRLEVPQGWRVEPAKASFSFQRAGEQASFEFDVSAPAVESREYPVTAVATAGGSTYRSGFQRIEHRDLETRYLYQPARTDIRGVGVKVPANLTVGYVMGVGDEIPAGIRQLGAEVRLLSRQDLATLDLGQFQTIITGTRAYGVRDDLRTYHRRLLEFARGGGHLVVLYNTPDEYDPAKYAPYPAVLPDNAEEVVEEDSPVEILAVNDPVFHTPNEITTADFAGWIEQRGSKFFGSWDPAYTAMISTSDHDQSPQKGGWVSAAYGKGRFTYFAYAFHRQIPFGVPGAYRLLANLLAQGQKAAN